jgi:hypothetical protein
VGPYSDCHFAHTSFHPANSAQRKLQCLGDIFLTEVCVISSTGDHYDWFTPADLTRVIDAIHALPDWRSVVLVGGQSLTAWVEYYKIKLPAFEGPYD